MRSVNIAELKNHLSAYLQQVRAGEEIIVRDRNLPVAKLVSLAPIDASAEELALAATDELLLPSKPFNERAFWAAGRNCKPNAALSAAVNRAVSEDRDERDGQPSGTLARWFRFASRERGRRDRVN